MGEIAFVVGDVGSCNELVQVAPELEKRGVSVRWFADPSGRAGTEVLAKKGIDYKSVPPEGWYRELPKVFLIGTSATATGFKIATTRYGQARGIPVIWEEDLWGTGSRQSALEVSPDVMLVNDEMAAAIAKNVRPNLKTAVVGKPTFGKIPPFEECPQIRARIREKLGLSDSDFLVAYGFGGEPFVLAVSQVEVILNDSPFSPDMIVAWRFHPKHPKKDELWEKATSSSISVDARSVDLLELYLSSNAVIVGWGGTDGYKVLLRGTPVITPLFPKGREAKEKFGYDDEEERRSIGYINAVPPILMGHENWGASSISALAMILRSVRSDEEALRHFTRRVRSEPFQGLEEPGAASRIADEVMKFL